MATKKKSKKPEPKDKLGRKTKYSPELCYEIIEMMAEGKDITTVCLELRISRFTHYAWEKKHPAYKMAVEEGKFWAEGWHHERGRLAMIGEIPGFMAGVWTQAGKNRFDLYDKVENKHNGKMQIERIERVIVDPANTNG